MLLATGLPMFAIGAVAEVGVLAILGMLMILVGALIWARAGRCEQMPHHVAERGWWRYPVNIPATVALTVGVNTAIALLIWTGSR